VSEQLQIFVAGAVIGLASTLVGIVTQHLLTLRREKIKREWEKQDKLQEELVKQVARVESLDELELFTKSLDLRRILDLRSQIDGGWLPVWFPPNLRQAEAIEIRIHLDERPPDPEKAWEALGMWWSDRFDLKIPTIITLKWPKKEQDESQEQSKHAGR
jgi:hypothetical protein